MRKRNMKALAMVAAAALVLAGCSGGGGSATTAAKEEATTQAAASEEKATEAAADTTAAAAEKTTDYPNKPIDLVVPFAAGGNVDLSCRILAQELEKELGQPVNVLNKEGGGAVVGQTYAVTQKPDGYTMLALTSSYVTNVLSGATTYDMDSITPHRGVLLRPRADRGFRGLRNRDNRAVYGSGQGKSSVELHSWILHLPPHRQPDLHPEDRH